MRSGNPTSPAGLVDCNAQLISAGSSGRIDWGATLERARTLRSQGVEKAVVTTPRKQLDLLRRRVPQMQELLRQQELGLQVTPCVELEMHSELFDHIIHTATVLGGVSRHYVFLRVAHDNTAPVLPVVDAIRRMRLTPIIVSPERVARFRQDPSEVDAIVKLGGRLQLSTASICEPPDRDTLRFCRRLIRSRLCHLVATGQAPIHHASVDESNVAEAATSLPGNQPATLAAAWQRVASWEDELLATALFRDNPASVFRGDLIEPLPKRSVRRFFSTFRRSAA